MEEHEDSNSRNTKRVKPNAPNNSNKRKADPLSRIDELGIMLKKQNQIVQLGKNALRTPDPPYVDILVDTLLEIPVLENSIPNGEDDDELPKPNGTPDPNSKKIEFEVRIGQLQGKNFQPGIQKPDFEAYKQQLAEDPDMTCDITETVLYYFDLSTNDGNIRIEVDEESQTPVRSQIKQRLKVHDLEISSLPYAVRLSIATESDQPVPVTIPDTHKLRRHKTRWSFYKKNAPYSWHVDLTEVRTLMNGETTDVITYEIEFDFNEDVITACQSGDKTLVRQIANQYWDFSVRLLNLLHKSGASHFDPSINLEKITDDEKVRSLRETTLDWIYGNSDYQYSEDFPGSMPINFSKRDIGTVQHRPYFVSEKTDGIRAMLLIIPRDGVYLIDRRFDFYLVPEYECLIDLYAVNGVTLLDGELITHLATDKQNYLIFDICAFNGTLCTSEILSKRLPSIQKVVSIYRNAVANGKIPSEHPFVLIGKTLFVKEKMDSLTSHIMSSKGHRVYREKDDKRYHKTDGIIFTPDEKYRPRTVRNMFKWKYVDEMSIDLKVNLNRGTGNIYFTCMGDRNAEVEYPIQMYAEDLARLTRYANHMLKDQKNAVIVECVYDNQSLKWKLKMVRTDKNRANHIRVVQNTIEVINENLSINDLKHWFPPKH